MPSIIDIRGVYLERKDKMDEFENSLVNGIHASRYIVSWVKSGGSLKGSRRDSKFVDWLKSLTVNERHLTEEEIDQIYYLSSNGKMELEHLAKDFLKEGA